MAELLAPAGNIEALDAAIGEGADAVYLGLKSFNARLRTTNFAWNQFEAAVQSLHRMGKKIFVTVNTVIEESETERMYRFLAYLDKIGPDGLIVQDLGVVRMVQQFFPNLRLHASTQMNIASAKAANTMSRSGIKRVVLARELSLEEIRQIKERTSTELEVFVHGALCVSESGLCLFSSYLGGKSANRGMCTQACRRLYSAESERGLQEGYYFSPYDLQLVDKIPDLIETGVDSFKIEGRMKSAEYVGSVVSAYRYLIDHWREDKKGAVATAKRMLSTDFARAKTLYWYMSDKAENILNPEQASGTGIYLGKITQVKNMKADVDIEDVKESALANDSPYGHYAVIKGGTYDPIVGDSIRLHKKDDSRRESYKIKSIYEGDKQTWIDIPSGFGVGDAVYLIQTKSMSKRYKHVLPNDLSRYRSQPGGQELPILDLTSVAKEELDFMPEGLYVQVSTVKDLFAVQGEKPVRVILELNSETKKALVETKEKLPFSKKQMYISLDPYVPQEIEDSLSETIEYLVNEGFRYWVVNNPAHIATLRAQKATMIAGPYLYTFNRWAVSWLENQDISALVTPLENSKRNIEETFTMSERRRVLVTVFAYPALFRMRFTLPESYDFIYFADKDETVFKALSTPDGSFVLPDNPFSILDRAKPLRDMGFTRLLVDLSKTNVKRNEFKQIMASFYTGKVLPETTRFNWKDGFYSPEKIEARLAMTEAFKQNEEQRYGTARRGGRGARGGGRSGIRGGGSRGGNGGKSPRRR